jgi:serine/threonine-protein kinase
VGEVVPGVDGDLYGDGVNTAARLQQSAEPGQVVVSEDVWRPLRQRSQHRFAPLGERRLKGLAAPIRVFRVEAGESNARAAQAGRGLGQTVPWRRILYAAAAAALIGIVVYGVRARDGRTDRQDSAPDPATATASLAVAPFDNLSPDPEAEYFADGLTEELIGSLGRLEQLRVAGRASSFALKGRSLDARAIGEELAVGTVLEGSVRKTGERVRVTAQLVDTRTGFQLWSDTYDRESGDIFAVQEEIARAVGEALDLRLPRVMESFRVRARPPDLEAYELYLRGRHAWRSRSRQGVELAVDLFRRAIARDPSFAEAHAGLADAYIVQAVYGYHSREEALPRAREAVERALALDSLLVEALATRGYLRDQDHETDAALADFHRAIELNPSYPLAHHWLALALVAIDRLDEALEQHRRALELDPLSPTPQSAYANTLLLTGDLDGAEEMAGRANALGPELWFPLSVMSRIHEARGQDAEAVQAAESAAALAPDIAGAQANLARIHAQAGDRHRALGILTALEAEGDPCAACIAEVYVALGEYEEAFRWMDAQIWFDDDQGGGFLPKVDPLYDPLRGDPRFAQFLKDVGV